jgi:predicted anti-sigma-YlaC factor YlaD
MSNFFNYRVKEDYEDYARWCESRNVVPRQSSRGQTFYKTNEYKTMDAQRKAGIFI